MDPADVMPLSKVVATVRFNWETANENHQHADCEGKKANLHFFKPLCSFTYSLESSPAHSPDIGNPFCCPK